MCRISNCHNLHCPKYQAISRTTKLEKNSNKVLLPVFFFFKLHS